MVAFVVGVRVFSTYEGPDRADPCSLDLRARPKPGDKGGRARDAAAAPHVEVGAEVIFDGRV